MVKIKPFLLAIASAVFFCALLPVAGAASQSAWTAIPPITSVKQLGNGVELRGGNIVLQVIAVQDSVVRVRALRAGQSLDDRSSSWAVVQRPSRVKIKNFVQDSARVQFDLPSFRVRIEKSPLSIQFLDFQNQLINQDDPKFPMAFNGEEFRIWKSMPSDEHYFGLGDKAGPIDHRNQAFCDRGSYIFVRASHDETVLVAFNNSAKQRRLVIPVAETPAAAWLSLQPIF